jgi:hypothetical protein
MRRFVADRIILLSIDISILNRSDFIVGVCDCSGENDCSDEYGCGKFISPLCLIIL